MKKLMLLLLGLGLLLIPATSAQGPDLTAEETVTEFYRFLFSATPEDYPLFLNFVCPDFSIPEEAFIAFATARGDASVSTRNLSFSVEVEDDTTALITIEGQVSITEGSEGMPTIVLPQEVRVVRDDFWRLCPTAFPASIASLADAALTQADAQQTAINFYAAFYTGNVEQVNALSCIQAAGTNSIASRESFPSGYEVQPSEWDVILHENGLAYDVETVGDLNLLRDGRFEVVVNTATDFTDAHMVRQEGWKFCGIYRPGQRAITDFARAYFSDAPADFVASLSCRQHRDTLADASQEWRIAIQQVNVPQQGLFLDADITDNEAEAANMQALVIIGDEIVSAATEFGHRARLVREGNLWKWCELPLDMQETESNGE